MPLSRREVLWREQGAFWSHRRRRQWRRQLAAVASGRRGVRLVAVARWLRELEALTSAAAFFEATTTTTTKKTTTATADAPLAATATEHGLERRGEESSSSSLSSTTTTTTTTTTAKVEDNDDYVTTTTTTEKRENRERKKEAVEEPGLAFLRRRRAWIEALSIAASPHSSHAFFDANPAVVDACAGALFEALEPLGETKNADAAAAASAAPTTGVVNLGALRNALVASEAIRAAVDKELEPMGRTDQNHPPELRILRRIFSLNDGEPQTLATYFREHGKKGHFEANYAQDMSAWATEPPFVYQRGARQLEKALAVLQEAKAAGEEGAGATIEVEIEEEEEEQAHHAIALERRESDL